MPLNQFLPWAIGVGANSLTPTDYAARSELNLGVQAGAASSKLYNTTARQAAVMVSMLGQWMADHQVGDVLDDGNVTNLEAQFMAALKAVVSALILGDTTIIQNIHNTALKLTRTSITATGAYTLAVPSGITAMEAEGVGAGAGGGYGLAGSGVPNGGGGGGGGGAYLKTVLTVAFGNNITGSVGAPGAAGTAGGTNGSAGGDTTITYGGVTVTAGGGSGGLGANANAAPNSQPGGSVTGTVEVARPGQPGDGGLLIPSGGNTRSGDGGMSTFGGYGGRGGTGGGNPGSIPGGGGAGSAAAGTAGSGARGEARFAY